MTLIKRATNQAKLHYIYLNRSNEEAKAAIKTYLNVRNIGAEVEILSKTICLMDATGSMGLLLSAAKTTVGTMFERARDILRDHKMSENSFQLQFVVYRDYDSKKEGLLLVSPWETKPENLRAFMLPIRPEGGGDYEEAIEIGLWHANEENEKDPISQVIIIGDAPAKNQKQIAEYRQRYGGEAYWQTTKFKQPTFYKTELQKLKAKKIPVHAFYLAHGCEANFREMATETNGICKFLDVNNPSATQYLTDFVTEEILKNVGQISGAGDALRDAYVTKYVKGHFK